MGPPARANKTPESCLPVKSLYLTEEGPVMTLGTPLVSGTVEVPPFDRDALITALRIDQAAKSTFARFLEASWRAGVIRYEVDFSAHSASYYGACREEYAEAFPR
jgi:uncharacterized protein YbcV (DUF1398 family)